MDASDFAVTLGPELAEALHKRGFKSLTSVQEAMLDPALSGRDLRISSQTGSGKTVAIGFALRAFATPDRASGGASGTSGGTGDRPKSPRETAAPRGLVIVPTRELAKQVDQELTWLYASLHTRVLSVTGGSSYRDEVRALQNAPAIVIGTPGRLLDHLKRRSIDPSRVETVVLDEADRMLDLGFREDLETILGMTPPDHRTHLVSATFPREVQALANRVQKNPASVEGTPLGTANADIDHVIHLVHAKERIDAIVNLLLAQPGSQTLLFARTRADVADITKRLSVAGFRVSSLSGEMEQAERNRALAAFKRGDLDALVATDVAARGIDVQDIAHVIHVEPPTDADSYTHRSGRTGRAGRKGKSLVLVAPSGLAKASILLKRAGVQFRVLPVPSADAIRKARDERLFAELTGEFDGEEIDASARALAARIADSGNADRALAKLLARRQGQGTGEPRDLTPIEAPARSPQPPPVLERAERARPPNAMRPRQEQRPPPQPRLATADAARSTPRDTPRHTSGEWVSFRVSWGQVQGADARRLLAMVCRRGAIRGSDVGSIRVTPTHSIVDVERGVAGAFERATREPDPRDPQVEIRRCEEQAPAAARGPAAVVHPARENRPKRPHVKHPKAEGRRVVSPSSPVYPKARPSRPARPPFDAKKAHRPR